MSLFDLDYSCWGEWKSRTSWWSNVPFAVSDHLSSLFCDVFQGWS